VLRREEEALLDTLNSQRLNGKTLLRDELVSVLNFWHFDFETLKNCIPGVIIFEFLKITKSQKKA
jgi:hypothetical protein